MFFNGCVEAKLSEILFINLSILKRPRPFLFDFSIIGDCCSGVPDPSCAMKRHFHSSTWLKGPVRFHRPLFSGLTPCLRLAPAPMANAVALRRFGGQNIMLSFSSHIQNIKNQNVCQQLFLHCLIFLFWGIKNIV